MKQIRLQCLKRVIILLKIFVNEMCHTGGGEQNLCYCLILQCVVLSLLNFNRSNISDYTAQNSRIIGEQCNGNELEGNGHATVWITDRTFACRDWEKSWKYLGRNFETTVFQIPIWTAKNQHWKLLKFGVYHSGVFTKLYKINPKKCRPCQPFAQYRGHFFILTSFKT